MFGNSSPKQVKRAKRSSGTRVTISRKSVRSSKVGALKKINSTLTNAADWMVLAALSAACSTAPTLTPVRMTIYSMAYNIYTNSMYSRPPHTFELFSCVFPSRQIVFSDLIYTLGDVMCLRTRTIAFIHASPETLQVISICFN